MRPDEHKKKKNEQYKKKHGVKKQKPELNQIDKKEKLPYKQEPQVVKPEHRNKYPSSEEEEIPTRARKFEKRQVKSNWDRYEEEIQGNDKADTSKGADFKHLLHNTATSLAQFRFKAEQIWEDDSDTGERELSSFLSINCDNLLSTVSCVPLNERLGIDSQHFQKSQLEYLKQCAEEHHSNYMKCKDKDTVQNDAIEDIISNINDANVETNKGCIHDGTFEELDNVLNDKTIADSDLKETKPDEKVEVHKSDRLESNKNIDDNMCESLKSSTNTKEIINQNDDDHDDLDALLFASDDKCKNNTGNILNDNFDTYSETCANKTFSETNKILPGSQKISNLEDQLDELLDLDNIDTAEELYSRGNKVEKSQSNSSALNDSKAANLEDWLDSVLDD